MEKLFVDKSWWSQAGTEYFFDEKGGGYRKHGATKTPLSWRIRPDDIVEAEGQMTPGAEKVMFYFKFKDANAGLFGRTSVNFITDPISTRKPR